MKFKFFSLVGAAALLGAASLATAAGNDVAVVDETSEAPESTVILAYNVDGVENVGTTAKSGTTGTKDVTVGGVKQVGVYNLANSMNGGPNGVTLNVEGGFKKGDIVTWAGCISNGSDSKYAKIVLGTYTVTTEVVPADPEKGTEETTQEVVTSTTFYTPEENVVDVKNDGSQPATVYTYTLTEDYPNLILGRDGNTGTFVTMIEVVRPANAGGDEPGENPGEIAEGTEVSAVWALNTLNEEGTGMVTDAVVTPEGIGEAAMTLGSNLVYKKVLDFKPNAEVDEQVSMMDLTFVEAGETTTNNNEGEHNRVNFTFTANADIDLTNISFNIMNDGWGDGRFSAYLTIGENTDELAKNVTPLRNNATTFEGLNQAYTLTGKTVAKGETATLSIALFSKNNNGAGKGQALSEVKIEGKVAAAVVEPVEPEYNEAIYNFVTLEGLDVDGTFADITFKEDGSLNARAHWQPIEYIALKNMDLTFTTTGTTAPALYATDNESTAWELRLYGSASYQTTMTINAPEGVKLYGFTTVAYGGTNDATNSLYTVDCGTLDASNATAVTWTAPEGGVDKVTLTCAKALKLKELNVKYTGELKDAVPTVIPVAENLVEEGLFPDPAEQQEFVNGFTMMLNTEQELVVNTACTAKITLKRGTETLASVGVENVAVAEGQTLPFYTFMTEVAGENEPEITVAEEGAEEPVAAAKPYYSTLTVYFAEEAFTEKGEYTVSIPQDFFRVNKRNILGAYSFKYVIPNTYVPSFPDATGEDAAATLLFDGTEEPSAQYSIPGVFRAIAFDNGTTTAFNRTRTTNKGGEENVNVMSTWDVATDYADGMKEFPESYFEFVVYPKDGAEFIPTQLALTWGTIKCSAPRFAITATRGEETKYLIVGENDFAEDVQAPRVNESTDDLKVNYTNVFRFETFQNTTDPIKVRVQLTTTDKKRELGFANVTVSGIATQKVGVAEVAADLEGAVLYDLSGRKVLGQPAPGLYIVVKGDKAQKVVLK